MPTPCSNGLPQAPIHLRSTLRLTAATLGFDNVAECPWHELRYQHVAAPSRRKPPASCGPRRVGRKVDKMSVNDWLKDGIANEHQLLRHLRALRA